MSKTVAGLLEVFVINPDEMLWSGLAKSVSSENSSGPFDILSQHANFVTMIKNKPIVIKTDKGEKVTYSYKSAIISVENDKVLIYSDI